MEEGASFTLVSRYITTSPLAVKPHRDSTASFHLGVALKAQLMPHAHVKGPQDSGPGCVLSRTLGPCGLDSGTVS